MEETDPRFADALARTLIAYRDRIGVRSFNLAIWRPPLGSSGGWERIPPIARIVDRGDLFQRPSDIGAMELLARRSSGATRTTSSPPFADGYDAAMFELRRDPVTGWWSAIVADRPYSAEPFVGRAQAVEGTHCRHCDEAADDEPPHHVRRSRCARTPSIGSTRRRSAQPS